MKVEEATEAGLSFEGLVLLVREEEREGITILGRVRDEFERPKLESVPFWSKTEASCEGETADGGSCSWVGSDADGDVNSIVVALSAMRVTKISGSSLFGVLKNSHVIYHEQILVSCEAGSELHVVGEVSGWRYRDAVGS